MTTAVYIYIAYTIISIAMTVWVARTLHKNGRIFLLALKYLQLSIYSHSQLLAAVFLGFQEENAAK